MLEVKMPRLHVVAVAAIFLAACSTTYKPGGFGGGYTDIPLARDTVRIDVRGNGYTDRPTEYSARSGRGPCHSKRLLSVRDPRHGCYYNTEIWWIPAGYGAIDHSGTGDNLRQLPIWHHPNHKHHNACNSAHRQQRARVVSRQIYQR